MKIHISYESEKERDAAFDALEVVNKIFPKYRLKEPKPKVGGRKHIYFTTIEQRANNEKF